jgi:outer membrane cobalamin receptor
MRLLCILTVLMATGLPSQAQTGNPYGDPNNQREEFVQHLSSRCRNLYDYSRTASQQQRSTEYERQRMQEARREFEEYCRTEVYEAMEKTYKKNLNKRIERADALESERKQTQVQQQNESRTRQQCMESKRIIANKRERTDLTPGELQDLARFEENTNKRCATPPSGATAATVAR